MHTSKTAGKISARLISVLLAMVLVVTMVPAFAFATSSEEPVATNNELGVDEGIEGSGEDSEGTEGAGEVESGGGTDEGYVIEEGADSGDIATLESSLFSEDSSVLEDTQSEDFSTLANGDPIDAQIIADNGTISFDGSADAAVLSYADGAEQAYNMKVVVTYPSAATDKKLKITLAEGVKFVDDASADVNVAPWLSGPVTDTLNTAPYGLSSNMVNTGSKEYNFINTTETVTLNLKVSADCRYWFDAAIDNGIALTLSDSTQTYEANLESVVVDSSNKTLFIGSGNYYGYAPMDTETLVQENYRLFGITRTPISWTGVPHFYEKAQATITVNDPNTIVKNTNTASWDLDSSSAASGVYVFTYKGAPLLTGGGVFNIPVAYEFPSGDFTGGEVVTAKVEPTATVYGNKELVWPARSMQFTVTGGEAVMFVNRTTVHSAMSSSVDNPTAPANSGSTSSILSGALGWYTIGNKGGTASGAQVVELNFNQTNLGVLGLDVGIPWGQTVSTIEYKTTGSDTWVPKTVSLSAESSTTECRYISFATLGLSDPAQTGKYITGIRYELESIPASSVIGRMVGTDCRSGIYGYTLAAGTGIYSNSTVSVYASGSNKTDGITGSIGSNHANSVAGISFNSVAGGHVNQEAGTTFSFSQTIRAMQNGRGLNAANNSAVENPTIYLRSESGNEISNLKITNNRGTVLSGYIVTPTFDGSVWIYKIDTSNITDGSAALAYTSIFDNGGIDEKYLTVTYDIATKKTDGGSYNYSDMLFVESHSTNYYHGVSVAQTDAPYGPHNIGSGSGRVWWLPVSNTGSYTITGRTDIVVGLAAKHYRATDYQTWTEGSDPIAIGVGDSSSIDVQLQVYNFSGAAVTNATTLYVPVPKIGDNWGSLMHNSEPFEFSMQITDPVVLPLGITGTVLYGKVTATDDGDTLNGYTFETWNASNASDYNCIKIIVDSLPNSTDPVLIDFKQKVAVGTTVDGLVDTWSPKYYQDLTNSIGDTYRGWVQGSYLSTTTALGELQGWIWLDDNANGKKEASENSLVVTKADGWTIDVYTAGTAGTGNPLQTGIPIGEDDDGSAVNNYYHLTDIISGSGYYDLVVNNPDNSSYIFTRVGTDTTDNKVVGTAADAHATGIIYSPVSEVPTSGSLEPEEGLYNIGVIPASTTYALTWQSQDTAKGTVTVTGTDAGSSVKSSGAPYETIKAAVTVNTKTGYTFAGWSKSATGPADASIPKTGPYGDNGVYGYDNIDYYAVFTTNTNTITYTYAGDVPLSAEAEPGPFTESYGTTQTVANAPAIVTGFTFKGWKPTSGITDADITAGSFTMPDVPVVFTGTWERNSHNVVYSYTNTTPPAGSDALLPTTVSTPFATSVTVSSPAPSLTGYTFSGWTSTDTDITSGTFSMPDKQVNIKGTWTAKTYTLTFDKGHDDTSGFTEATPTSKSVTYDTAVGSLPGDDSDASQVAPARTGYVFAGWATTKGAAAADFDKTHVWNTDGNLTVYAVWSNATDVKYTVEHYKVDSTDTPSTTPDATEELKGTTGDTVTASPKTATSDPVFMKGYTYDEHNPLAKPSGKVKADGTLVLRLYYKVNPYTVTYYANNGENVAPVTDTVYYNEDFTTKAADTFSRAGYTLVSWNNQTDGQGTIGYSPASKQAYGHTTNIDLYAQWSPNTGTAYKVEHYLVGTNGVPTIGQTQDLKGITDTTAVASPLSFTGYTYAPNHASAKPSGNIEGDGSLVLRLYYTINYYTVTFIDWNGTTLSSMQVAHGGSAIAPQVLGRAGYSFTGWDKAYTNVTGNLNVYALYSINYYTVTFLDWDGSVLSTQRVAYGGSASSPASPSRTGYTFTGWDRGYTNVTSNITVRALYTPVVVEAQTYTVTFLGYNDVVLQSSTVERGDSVTPPANPTRNGFRFTGWDKGSSAWTNVTADATIRATWSNETVTPVPQTQEPTGGDGPTITTSQQVLSQAAKEQGIPSIGVPLAAPAGFDAWALANLILAILGAVFVIMFVIIRGIRKEDDEDDEERRERKERAAQNAQYGQTQREDDEREYQRKRRNIAWLIGSIVLAVLGIIVFVLTQDISLPIVWFDMWTIVNAILFIGVLLLGNMAVRRKKKRYEDEEEDETAPAPAQ